MSNEIILQKIDMKVEEPPFNERVLLFLRRVSRYHTINNTYTDMVVIGFKHAITAEGPQFNYEVNGDYTKPTHWAKLPLNR